MKQTQINSKSTFSKLKVYLFLLFLSFNTTFASNVLNGTYTIDASGSGPNNYTTIAAAVSDLYAYGINGPVTFNLVGNFTEQIDLNGAITGSSHLNQIVFQNGKVSYTSTTSADNFIVRIVDARFIEFRDIVFTAQGTNYARIVSCETPNGYITFNNNKFIGVSAISSSYDLALIYCKADNSSEDLDNFKFTNNEFTDGTYGLFLESFSTNKSANLLISGNNFHTSYRAIHINNFDTPEIKSNQITHHTSFSNNSSISLYHSNNFLIEKNKISTNHTKGSGIVISNCQNINGSRSLIVNNFIQAHEKGISLSNSNNIDIYFNSINIEISTNIDNLTSASLSLHATCDSIKIQNNILNNKRKGYAFDGNTSNGNQVSLSDYNDFFTSGTNLCRWNNVNQSTLGDWLIYTGFDYNTQNSDPLFASRTNLHANSNALDNEGFPILTVVTDIDNELRNSTHPSIGADEYFFPLSGVYIIGSVGDYITISDAVSDLYSKGIDGAVTFKIKNGTYTEQINLDGVITGSSATNTVTFQSNSGNASDVEITHTASASVDNFVVRLNVAEYVKFRNLTLTAGGTDYARVVYFENVTGNLEFYGNIMNGYEITSGLGSNENQSIVYCGNTNKLNNTTFENNTMNNGDSGIYLNLNTTAPITTNMQIIGNTISTRSYSISIRYSDAPTIMSNILNNNSLYNISLLNCDNDFIIEKNIIYGNYGIYLSSCYGTTTKYGTIKNNIISVSHSGISINSCQYTNIYYNTVRNTSSSGLIFTPIRIYTSTITDNIRILNNILYASGGCATINWEGGTVTECNYNNLYTTGPTLVTHGSTNYATLAAWQAAPEHFDANSYDQNVTFVSSTDLHIVSTPVPLNGTTIATITEDIDGETRGTPPFIGADEPLGFDISIKV